MHQPQRLGKHHRASQQQSQPQAKLLWAVMKEWNSARHGVCRHYAGAISHA
jgi:hypothetical protein